LLKCACELPKEETPLLVSRFPPLVLKATITSRSLKNATKQEYQGKEGLGDTTALSVGSCGRCWMRVKKTLEISFVSLPSYNVLCL